MPVTKLKNGQLPDTISSKTVDNTNDINTTTTRLKISGGSNGQVLSTDGASNISWITAGGGVSDGDKGDITVSASGATWTIDNGLLLSKLQANTSNRLIGYASTGAPTALGLNASVAISGGNVGTGVAFNAAYRKDFFLTTAVQISETDYASKFTIQPGIGTWLIIANLVGFALNSNFVMHASIDINDASISEGSKTIMASGIPGIATSETMTLIGFASTTTLGTIVIKCKRSSATGFANNWNLINGTQSNDGTFVSASDKGTKISVLRVA